MYRVLIALCCAAALACSTNSHPADPETVAVIGTGDMGDSLGPRFAELGYRVVYGSRNPESDKVRTLVEMTGANASATTQMAAAQQGDIVLLLVPWPAMATVARNLGDLDGKIVVDVSMPLEQAEDGYPRHLLKTSSAEMIQEWNPGARVVKAFGTMGSYLIDEPTAAGGMVTIPVASDDRGAKEEIAGIVAALGLDPVDFGPLRMARNIEIMQMIYMIPLSQNRPEGWEFYFRRSDYYGCYLTTGNNVEGLVPVADADDLAVFPGNRDGAAGCAE